MPRKTIKRTNRLAKIDPKQDMFAALYFSPRLNGKPNPLFGNAYRSALEAGYTDGTAIKIVSSTEDKIWVREAYNKMVQFKPEHTIKQLEDIAMSPDEYTRDRLKALEMLGKIQGIFIDRQQTEVNVTFTNSVPRPTLEANIIK